MLDNYKKSLLALSILTVLQGNALAQENETQADEIQQQANQEKKAETEAETGGIEVIEVQGTRGSLKRSMNAKRFADQVMDGVSAEDIGKLPDDNIAEAISRVVGVSMSREAGEGEYVSIRGMDPSLSKVTVNGQSMASGNAGSMNVATDVPSRSVNLNNIASEMVGGIEVFKSPTANMVEGSVGGTVNLKTRKPIAVGNKGSVSVKGDYNDLADETGKGLNLFLNRVIDDDETLAFNVNFSYFDRTVSQNKMQARGWSLQNPDNEKTGGVPYINAPGYMEPGVYRLESIGSQTSVDERERFNVSTSIQWMPTDSLDINLGVLYAKQDRDRLSTDHNILFKDTDKLVVRPESIVIDGENVISQIVDVDGASRTNNNAVTFDRHYEDETFSVNLSADYELSENWSISSAIGSSRAKLSQDLSQAYFSSKVSGLGYRIENGSYLPDVIYPTEPTDLAAMEPQNMDLSQYKVKTYDSEDTQDYAQLDVEFAMDNDYFRSLEFGARYQQSEKIYDAWGNNNTGQENTAILALIQEANGGEQINLADYSNFFEVDNMLENAPFDAWFSPDIDAIDSDYSDIAPLTEIEYEKYEVKEDTAAVYTQLNISSEIFSIPVRGNAGVRYVETDVESSANEKLTGQDFNWITIEHDYSDVLPSINLAFTLQDEFIIRTAAASVMSRPSHGQLSASFRESGVDENAKYRLGNPKLAPFRANQYDLSAEWYFSSEGLLSAGLFYKDIEDFIVTVKDDRVLPGFNNGWPVEVQQPVNGDEATVEGVEISYQQAFVNLPGALSGFGTAINYTYNESETELVNATTGETMTLPGLSKDTFNATLYWEKYGVNVRLAYNYRSAYFKQFSWSGEAIFVDDYDQIDFTTGYRISRAMSVNFNIRNLTDETTFNYVGNESRAYQVLENGRTYNATLKYNF